METNSATETTIKGGKKDFSVLDLIHGPVFAVDMDKKVIYANEALADLVIKKREQIMGVLIGSLIKTEESGVDKALASGDNTHIVTWATIREKKYFLEFEPTPLMDAKGNITGVVGMIKDLTSQKLVLQAVQDMVAKAKAGDLSARTDIKAEGDYQFLIDGINAMQDAVVEPINELVDVLGRMAVNDLTKKVSKEYLGVWGDLKKIANDLHSRLTHIWETVTNISNGDLGDLEAYKKIGCWSENDTLVPAFIRLLESLKGVIGETAVLTGSVTAGDLSKRGNVEEYRGVYREIVQGTNGLIDAVANPLSELMTVLGQVIQSDISQKVVGQYQGVWGDLKKISNEVIARFAKIIEVVVNISRGDLSDLEDLKKIGRRSNKDELTPAFINMIEMLKTLQHEIKGMYERQLAGDIEYCIASDKFPGAYGEIAEGVNDPVRMHVVNVLRILDILKSYAEGDISPVLEKLPGKQIIANERMDLLRSNLLNVIGEINKITEAVVVGKLSHRGQAEGHEGVFRKIIESLNATLNAILLPIDEASSCLQEMAKGNLDTEMKGDYKGDHAVIKESLNATLEALNEILNQVAIAVDQVATGARQVSESSQSLSQAATEAASSLEEITASTHELTSQTNMNAENATQANQLAAQAKISAEKGNSEMRMMVKAMNDINESASGISKIIKAIDEIAFQTNLLALNAAVEAARAGVHGKGFTVVAEEVRNLAQRSATAAKETAEMIEESIKKTEAGAKIAEETSNALAEIVIGSTKVTDLIGEIASASKEQAQGIGQINQGLSQVDQVTQQVTASSEESASASEELSSQSLQLKQMLDKFSLRKRGFNQASGLPEGITPEMLQMLRSMLQSQQMVAAVTNSQPGVSGRKLPKKPGTVIKPSGIIALDDQDFGIF